MERLPIFTIQPKTTPAGLGLKQLWLLSYFDEHMRANETTCFRWYHFDGLVQERRNSSALAMELRLSCIKPIDLWSLGGKGGHLFESSPIALKTINLTATNAVTVHVRKMIHWGLAVVMMPTLSWLTAARLPWQPSVTPMKTKFAA